jgi:hypothetical protein
VFDIREQEQIVEKQAWSRQAIIASAVVVLAAAMPLTMDAQAYPFAHRISAGSQVATGADEGSTFDKANPTVDGSIIIECRVGFDGRLMSPGNGADTASTLHAVSMPQHPLGPSNCWSGKHNQDAIGGATGGLMTVF